MSTDHSDAADGEEQPTDHDTAANTDPRAQAADTGDFERAPSDFEADIDGGAVRVPSHPVFVYPKIKGEVQKCSARLVSQAEVDEYVDEAPDDDREAEAGDFGTEAIAELISEKYVSPEFDLSAEDIKNSPAGYYNDIFAQIVPELGN